MPEWLTPKVDGVKHIPSFGNVFAVLRLMVALCRTPLQKILPTPYPKQQHREKHGPHRRPIKAVKGCPAYRGHRFQEVKRRLHHLFVLWQGR